MRFMTMVKSKEGIGFPPQALMDGINALGQEAGPKLVLSGGLLPTSAGAKVALRKGEITVTDGPFTEAKEVVGGYAVYEVKSKAEAVEWSRRFLDLHKKHWPGFEGEVELRQLMEFPGA